MINTRSATVGRYGFSFSSQSLIFLSSRFPERVQTKETVSIVLVSPNEKYAKDVESDPPNPLGSIGPPHGRFVVAHISF